MGHFSGDRGRLFLVATADDLDALTLEPVEESFQVGAGHCADLVPDDHTGNELLPHPFRRPLHLATPSEEAVVGLGLDAPGPHLFGQAMRRGEDEGISLAEELDRSRGFCRCSRHRLGSSSGASTAGRRGAVRRGAGSEVLFCCLKVRLGEVGCMFHGHVELLVLVTLLGWGDRVKVLLPEQTGNAHDPAAVAFFHGHESFNPFKPL